MTWNRNSLPFRKYEPKIDPAQFDWKRFLGNAPDQPFDPYIALGNWRWYWDFGAGILGDLMVHWLDAVNWVLDLGMPDKAVTLGANYATKGVWQTPDTIETILQYPDKQVQVHFAGTFVNQHEKAGTTFMGTDATLYADRGRYEIYPEPRRDAKIERFVPGSGEKGADFDIDGTKLHIANWLECVRSREKPVAPAEAGVVAADAAHFANKALREEKVMTR
jgi:predicted dehydrogenase